jgi:hypothetical protein
LCCPYAKDNAMPRRARIDAFKHELNEVLQSVSHLSPTDREIVLQASLKYSRERRYFDRDCSGVQEWRSVVRPRYTQYLVSNWGFVRHSRKPIKAILRPAFGHEYARAPFSAAHRNNGATQHMIHELVFESFVLGKALPPKATSQTDIEVINHLDGDKYNPALDNLELTDQGRNMLHAYQEGLRSPRS